MTTIEMYLTLASIYHLGGPRSDTCSKCDELNIKIQAAENDDKKKSLEAELNIHHCKAERFYDEIKTDTIRSKEDPTFEVVTFDFQQNLPLPHLPVNDIFLSQTAVALCVRDTCN